MEKGAEFSRFIFYVTHSIDRCMGEGEKLMFFEVDCIYALRKYRFRTVQLFYRVEYLISIALFVHRCYA